MFKKSIVSLLIFSSVILPFQAEAQSTGALLSILRTLQTLVATLQRTLASVPSGFHLAQVVTPTTVALQQGVNGYSGASDTFINEFGTATDYSTSYELALRGSALATKSLVKYDLSSIPTGSTVTSAVLELYLHNPTAYTASNAFYSLHRVLPGRNWAGSPNQTNWTQYLSGSNWAGAGMQSGTDYETSSASTLAIPSVTDTAGWRSFDITSLTQQWINGTENNGLVILLNNVHSRYFYSSNHTNTSLRPRLTITYTSSGTPPPPGGDTQAPTVPPSINGTAISSSQINLAWSASSDNVGVSGYRLYRGGNLIATAGGATFTHQDTGLSPSTTYSYTVAAYDAAGNSSAQTSGVLITTYALPPSPDVTPPAISISSPGNGSTVSGTTVTVSANASDNVGVVGVTFFLDGANLGLEDYTAPYAVTWNSTQTNNGPHTLTARVRDAANNNTVSSAVNVTVSNASDFTPPTVSISSPAGGSTQSGSITVSAVASDPVVSGQLTSGVSGVQFLLDGANLGAEDTVAPYSVTWETTYATNGSHTFTARARDGATNQTTSAPVSVTVNNLAPPPPPPTGVYQTSYGITIPAAHPRLWFTPTSLARARAWYQSNQFTPSNLNPVINAEENALRALLSNNSSYCQTAADWALNQTRTFNIGGTSSNDARWYGEEIVLVWDWCYDYFTTANRVADRNEIMNTWNTYNDTLRQRSWGGPSMIANNYHWGYLRNELLWAIASYGESDGQNTWANTFFYDALVTRFGNNFVPYANGPGKGGVPVEGYQYGRYLLDYPVVPFTTMENWGRQIFEEGGLDFYKGGVYYLIYATTPQPSSVSTAGSVVGYQTFPHSDDQYWNYGRNAEDPTGNGGYNLGDFMSAATSNWANSAVGQHARTWLSMVNPTVSRFATAVSQSGTSLSFSSLPLDYYAPGPGYLYGRNQWGTGSTLYNLQLGNDAYESGHDHQDSGNWQIWRNGRWISRESVGYQGVANHTIVGYAGNVEANHPAAHNTLLVNGRGPIQTYPTTNISVTRLESRNDYSFSAVNLTPLYGTAATRVEREYLFIRPLETMVIFDRVEAPASSAKTFLVHSETNPTVDQANRTITATNGTEAMRLLTLLPAAPAYRTITEGGSIGQYRTEIETSGQAQTYLLNVVQAKGATDPNLTASVVDTGSAYVATLTHPTRGTATITFNKGMISSGGTITVSGQQYNLNSAVQSISVTDSGPAWGALSGGTTPPPATLPVISSFSASPTSITSGQSSTLSWNVSGATSLSINQAIGTVTGTTRSVSPTVTTTYTLTATNASGSVTAQTTVTVGTTPPPPTNSTTFTPGQRVQTTSNLNVRATASAAGTLLGTQPLGSLGTIVSGGTSVDGFYWWNVNYDNAPDGYSVEDYLTAYTAVPPPPPPPTGDCSPVNIRCVGTGQEYTTIQAAADVVNPGDTIQVYGGNTYGTVNFRRAGTATSPITVRGIRVNGQRPAIAGSATAGTRVVQFTLANNYIFEGFEVYDTTGTTDSDDICVRVEAANVTLRDISVHNCGHGILGTDYNSGSMTLEYVEVYRSGGWPASGNLQHPIYIATDSEAYPNAVLRVQYSYLHDNGGEGIKTRARRNEIYYNWLQGAAANGTYYQMSLYGPEVPIVAGIREDSEVVGNVMIATDYPSNVRIGSDMSPERDSQGRYRFLNNTFISLAPSGSSPDFIRAFGQIESLELVNNVFYSQTLTPELFDSQDSSWTNGVQFSGRNNWIGNNVTNVPVAFTGTIRGTDPGLTSTQISVFDPRPSATSLLVNAGTSNTTGSNSFPFPSPTTLPSFVPPVRLSSEFSTLTPTTRTTTGSVIDIGAFESSSGTTPPPATLPVISSFSASPTSITSGQSSTLSWNVSGATSLSINQAIGTVTGTTRSVSPTVTTTYTLTATNASGSVTAQTTVTVGTTPPPPTNSTTFTPGQRVQANPGTGSNLNVRATASATGTLLGTQPQGSLGTVVSSGTSVDNFYWWNVNWDSGVDGYSVEDYLTSAPTTPAIPLAGDLNLDHIVNSLDFSLMNSRWNQNYPSYDLNSDSIINSLDYAILSSNWLRTW